MSIMITTNAGETGELAAEAIRDVLDRATNGANIATFVEGASPLAWADLADGGWDEIGIAEDEDGATLRDLVEVALAWGHSCVQLPLLPAVLAKRHSAAARQADGPVTFALPSTVQPEDLSYVPFGQHEGIRVALGLGAGSDDLAAVPAGEVDELALTMRGVVSPIRTALSVEAAREVAVVLAAEAAGAGRRLLDDAVDFAKEREQFGRPIGSFQAVKHHLANALIAVELAETAVIRASQEEHEAFRSARFAVDRAVEAAEIAMQVHGGLGFTWEMGLHFYLRHILMARELVTGLSGQHA
jgi:alkylation response protein AidB-like acyl-CoA dehydrogenase